MRTSWPPRTCLLIALSAALITSRSPSAEASGFLNPRLADPHGHPALDNPYALYFNPAALGGIEGTQIVIDGTLAYRTVDYTRAASALSPQTPATLNDPTYRAANTGPAHAANFVAIPFLAAASDFGSRYFFGGLGMYVPFGGAVMFDQRPEFAANATARGAVDGSQRWAAISGVQRSLYATGALGFRVPHTGLSCALSASAVFTDIEHDQARNTTGFDDLNSEGRALLQVQGTEIAMSAGLYWEALPKKRLRLGISYAVRPGFGEMKLSGTLRQFYNRDADKDVDFFQTYPDVIRFGIAARPVNSLELRFDSEYVGWSSFDHQCIVSKGSRCDLAPDGSDRSFPPQVVLAIRRKWRDAGAMRLGAGYFADQKTEVYGSAGYDTSAVTSRTLEPTYPDAFKLMFSLGVRRRLTDFFALGASYTLVQYLSVTASSEDQAALAGASKNPNEDGTYKSRVMFFNFNATLSL